MRVSTNVEKYKKLRRFLCRNDAFFDGTTHFLSERRVLFVRATLFFSGARRQNTSLSLEKVSFWAARSARFAPRSGASRRVFLHNNLFNNVINNVNNNVINNVADNVINNIHNNLFNKKSRRRKGRISVRNRDLPEIKSVSYLKT